jgi:hypothetical protein
LDAETQSQINDLVEVRDAHKKRLKHLAIQAAYEGLSIEPAISIEIEQIEARVLGIEEVIARLRQREVRLIASIVPNSTVDNITDIDLHDRVSAIGNYVMDVETAIHKEMGALMRIFDLYSIADEAQRVARQKRLDLFIVIVIVLLLSNIIILFFK